jgi:arsenate reductase-like glutaredoxin family protein
MERQIMAKKIDWLYKRNSCTTCKKSMGYFEEAGVSIKETVDGTKTKYGLDDAKALLEGMTKLVSMKGQKIVTVDLKKEQPTDEVLTSLMIGPTGNLRAPTFKVGKTLVIGFSEEAYAEILS